MNKVGIKAVYQETVVNQDTGESFGIFVTKDFLERVSIKSEYINSSVKVGDIVRLDFVALPYLSKEGKNTAFLACKVVGVC